MAIRSGACPRTTLVAHVPLPVAETPTNTQVKKRRVVTQASNPVVKVCVEEKLAAFADYWSPRIVAELNDQHIKLVKLHGDFVWHLHEHEDELFYVIKGTLVIELRDRNIVLNPGEFVVIPKGVEHRPVARDEVHVMLFEPAGTVNTGNNSGDLTVTEPQHI
ncbi:MAG: cupin domain-containing protein [Gammaproteobacteria bacterium]|nr:cupin domain-containing protein [Gammaproteobacteria bacterium]